jgi:type VI protein secretion system component Hcp
MGVEEAGRIARAAERVRRRSRVPLKLLLPTAAALGAGAAVAVGSIPGSDGTITGCYNVWTSGADFANGTLRVVDPAATPPPGYTDAFPGAPINACGPDEKQITWNQQGPTGPTGPTGPQGPEGGNGAPGSIIGETTFDVETGHGSKVLLKLDGVSGSVSTKGQAGAIGLDKFAFGAEGTVASAAPGTGAGAGKVNVQTFEFVKQVDKASPTLFRDEVNGTVISKAEVDVYHSSKGALTELARYDLSRLVIKNITHKGSTETVLGVFQAVSSSLGSGQNKVSTGWNQVSNTGWDLTATKTP